MNRTWILVADAAHARLFEVPHPGEPFQFREEFDNPAGRAKGRDFLLKEDGAIQHQEGSVFRSSMEPLSMKKVEARRFAHSLAQMLDKSVARHQFERLILVAAPEFLGMLRKELSQNVENTLLDSIPRDYGRSNARELETLLGITHLA